MNDTSLYAHYLAAYGDVGEGGRGAVVGRGGTIGAPVTDSERAAWALGVRDARAQCTLRVKPAVERAVARMMGEVEDVTRARVVNSVLVELREVTTRDASVAPGASKITVVADADFDPMIYAGARRIYLLADNRTDEELIADEAALKSGDLSAAKTAMKNVAEAGKASSGMPVDADSVAKKIGVSFHPQNPPSRCIEVDITPRCWAHYGYYTAAPVLAAVLTGGRYRLGPLANNYALGALTDLRVGHKRVSMMVLVVDKTDDEVRAAAKEVAEYVNGFFPQRFNDFALVVEDATVNAAMKDVASAIESLKHGACKVTVENMAGGEAKQPNAGDLADMKAATQGLGVVAGKVVERVITKAGVAEQTTSFPRLDPPNMGDVWEPRLGGPPITLLFFDPTCGSFGAWRTGYGDEDWISTDALRTSYTQKFTLQGGGCSWATAVATWAAVRAKVTYPARVANLVINALGENAKMPEIKAAVAALALSEKSAASAK